MTRGLTNVIMERRPSEESVEVFLPCCCSGTDCLYASLCFPGMFQRSLWTSHSCIIVFVLDFQDRMLYGNDLIATSTLTTQMLLSTLQQIVHNC
jgi:hypothetical protein